MVRTQKFDLDTDTTLGGNNASDYIAPSQKAIKDYVDNHSGGSPVWGNITGTLSNQTDLQNALNNKVNGVVDANGIIIGTNADADYGVVVGNNSGLGSNYSSGIVIGSNSSSNVDDSVIIGENSNYSGVQNGSIVIGCGNEIISNEGGQSIVIGRDLSTGTAAIGEKKLIVGLGTAYELCDLSTGLIPDARISSNIARTSQIPTESTVSGWGFTKNTGTVTSVNNTSPDANGNVTLSIPQQVQANWNETDTTSKSYIQNKPTIPDTSTLEKISNKVTSISSSSTDTQYPSAKCVYDELKNKEDKFEIGFGLCATTINFTPAVQNSNLGENHFWEALAYDGTKFVALSYSGYISTSTDGTNWTPDTQVSNLGSSYQWFALAYDGTKFVALDRFGYISTSTDGTTWTTAIQNSNLGSHQWYDLAYDGTKFVALSYSGYISTSTDGTNWTTAIQNSNLGSNTWEALAYDGTKFVALSNSGYISTSTDGTNWTTAIQNSNLGSLDWRALAYDGTKFVALSNSGYISTSTDGTNWTTATQNSILGSYTWRALTYGNNKFVALGYYGHISTFVNSNYLSIKSPAYITNIYTSGYSWYRVWCNGFIEQGGRVVPSADANLLSVTFPKAFTDNTYPPKVITTPNYNTASGYTANTSNCTNRNATLWSCTIGRPTKTGFVVNRVSANWEINWYACGY